MTILRIVLILTLALPVVASAEWYGGGQIGGVFPSSIGRADVQSSGLPAGTSFANVDLDKSIMYGAKAGYWFTKQGYDWLGLETEVYNANPNIPQQRVGLTVPPVSVAGTVSGSDLRVLTWAPFIVKVRHQAGPWQPYAGVGLGLFFAKSNLLGPSASDTAPGLVTHLGVEYRLNKDVGLFGEWKYNHAHLSFTDAGLTISGNYDAHVLAVGVNFHLPN